ncbi:MAG: hypothetical protein JJ909_00275 [Roseivirga sp.]|uniref:hypothetical protein n=1 Tax=Roseivirga sp. TaxID=1964215 RepID=UPI001B0A8C39|nr:hypothetical protein [Roseivirga sp.]MBO6660613.1 hypothetical protein [Roseivirga sp.]MBO6759396.1 hypothetical protein [Roseivirga sp.]MBO6906650.1 hypothetical protein [Roseivirga sp.]
MHYQITVELNQLENNCFVVMPFNSLYQTQYEKIIKPSLEELNIKCIRGDEIYSKQRIVDDIWKSIRNCRFVLAELSGKNPNVMYEVGLAHAIGKPVIIITRNSDDVPFDLKALRYLFYDTNDPFWGENLKTGIQNLVQKVIEAPNIQDYLDGISHSNIAFPEIAKTPKIKTKTNKLPNISGSWYGEYLEEYMDKGLKYLHKFTLHINQYAESLVATSVSTSADSYGKLTVVQQILNGDIEENHISLRGVNYTFVERGSASTYYLDSFNLDYNHKDDQLIGTVTSDVETEVYESTIILKRVTSGK